MRNILTLQQIQQQQMSQLQQIRHLQLSQELAQQQSAAFAENIAHTSSRNFYSTIPDARRIRDFKPRRKLTNEELFESTGLNRKERKVLLRIIGPDLKRKTARSQAMSPLQILTVAMRALTTGDELWNCGYFIGVSRSSACRALKEFCRAVVKRLYKIISLKGSIRHWRKHAMNMWKKYKVPNCVGAFDGTIIKVFNKDDRNLYWSRKMKPAINAQIMVDSTGLIRFVSCKAPGSWHDRRAYGQSRLAEEVNEGWRPFPGACVLADNGYAGVTEFLLPIPKRHSPDAAVFYRRHRRARRFVENCFANLKNSYRILRKGVYLRSKEDVGLVIQTTCILYNFRKIMKSEHLVDQRPFPLIPLPPRNGTFASQIINLHNILHGLHQ